VSGILSEPRRRSPALSAASFPGRAKAILLLIFFAILFCLGSGHALAVNPNERLKDPVLEARARTISKQLRCVVCQNQTIDDSNADLAHDLRVLVRERLKAGDTDQQVIDYITARYGDFVLLKPPFEPLTWVLWLGPPLVLVLGGIGIAVFFRRRRGIPKAPPPLSDDERRRLDALLREEPG
jgi:cytochrome c-type biogenesis protein CcmH